MYINNNQNVISNYLTKQKNLLELLKEVGLNYNLVCGGKEVEGSIVGIYRISSRKVFPNDFVSVDLSVILRSIESGQKNLEGLIFPEEVTVKEYKEAIGVYEINENESKERLVIVARCLGNELPIKRSTFKSLEDFGETMIVKIRELIKNTIKKERIRELNESLIAKIKELYDRNKERYEIREIRKNPLIIEIKK